jgi:hypothetical protein
MTTFQGIFINLLYTISFLLMLYSFTILTE